MIDLRPCDIRLAQNLLDRVSSIDEHTKHVWINYIICYMHVDSDNALVGFATALKGLREHKLFRSLQTSLKTSDAHRAAWKRYCSDPKSETGYADHFKRHPGLNLTMRLCEETKCFSSGDNSIPPPNELSDNPDEDYIVLNITDPGKCKVSEIYERFGNGKAVSDKPIVEIMEEVLNKYKFPVVKHDGHSLKLFVRQLVQHTLAIMLLENINAFDSIDK